VKSDISKVSAGNPINIQAGVYPATLKKAFKKKAAVKFHGGIFHEMKCDSLQKPRPATPKISYPAIPRQP